MARVNYVKHARARFEMVTVTNEDGSPKQVPVLRADGTPKKTKKGKEIVRTLTVQDRTKPLPNYKCGKCGKEIEPGMPYKWIEPRSGPYGENRMVRCADCPPWQIWEYSSSLSARIAEIQHNAGVALSAEFDTPYDIQSVLADVAQEARDLAAEKQEAADNMESGFGHAIYQSDELAEQAQNLEGWADDIENADIPELPEPEEQDCSECDATGEIDGEICSTCSGDKTLTPEEPTDEQMDEWLEEARSAAQDIVNSCPA